MRSCMTSWSLKPRCGQRTALARAHSSRRCGSAAAVSNLWTEGPLIRLWSLQGASVFFFLNSIQGCEHIFHPCISKHLTKGGFSPVQLGKLRHREGSGSAASAPAGAEPAPWWLHLLGQRAFKRKLSFWLPKMQGPPLGCDLHLQLVSPHQHLWVLR